MENQDTVLTTKKEGLKVDRYYTKENIRPFNMFNYKKISSIIKNPNGSIVFSMDNVEVPEFWSQTAADILAQKYFRKAGVPLKNAQHEPLIDENGKVITGSENSIKQVAHRLAGCWRFWGEKHNYFATPQDAQIFYDEMVYLILGQFSAPNSPQWFNTGLNWAYGITGSAEGQGYSFINPNTKQLEYSSDAYYRMQPHACFIQSVSDDLVREGGIFSLLTREARIFKYGSGTGSNFSTLRGKGEPLTGGGSSSGLMSFLKIFDVAASSIKSGGTTRRAAKMLSLDLDHPEIEDFIWWKVREEEKVADLVTGSKILKKRLSKVISLAKSKENPLQDPELRKALRAAARDNIPISYLVRSLDLAKQGYELPLDEFDTHYESEAYQTVSGQNSNNSVRISNKFFSALEENKDWHLIGRIEGNVMKTIPARQLWDQIGYCAWASADPGVQFDDTINEWHTCPVSGKINGSNPCSEYMFLNDTACNLASINLVKFYDPLTGKFDVHGYRHAIRLWTIVLEISVLMAHFPSEKVAKLSYEFRTLGLGFANIGTLLMLQGIPYDSEEGRTIAGVLSAIMTGEAYKTSAEMAQILGPFEKFFENREPMLRVIRNHRRSVYHVSENEYENLTIKPKALNQELCPLELLTNAHQVWDEALSLGEHYGYRNAQVTVLAPTGTIAFVMDCDTTGVEPDYALVKHKKLSGGGFFKIVNQSVPKALERLGYDEQQIKDIIDYCVGHGTFQNNLFINQESLMKKGLTFDQIQNIEKELPNSMDIRYNFNEYSLGKEFYQQIMKRGNPDFLINLGFSEEEIDNANQYICGTMTIEGAPHLKEEHYPVFDCANKCGKIGTRFIHPYGHLKMLAAAQPFISGAISKTINMPREWTIEQIKKAYYDSWTMMIKAVALYRDGCKLSQPLNSTLEKNNELREILEEEDLEEEKVDDNVVKKTVQIGPKELTLIGNKENDQLKEINLEMDWPTPVQKVFANTLINSINLSLKQGLSSKIIVEETLTEEGHPVISELRQFMKEFILAEDDFSEEEQDLGNTSTLKNSSLNAPLSSDEALLLSLKKSEHKCHACGANQMRPNGTCMICEVCGETTGCS